MLLAAGVDLTAVELPLFLRVRQQPIGGRDFLDPRLGLGVTRIEVGMVLLSKLAIGFADIVLARVAAKSQHSVGILQVVSSLTVRRRPPDRLSCARLRTLGQKDVLRAICGAK